MKKHLLWLILTLLAALFSYHFLDLPTARYVTRLWRSGHAFHFFSISIPDMLFPLVFVITTAAWTAYLILLLKGIRNEHTRFFLLVAIALPLAYVLKSVAKSVFGRIETRYWLAHPGFHQFHWLDGSGNYTSFPSGHMTVFMALATAVCGTYPRYRTLSAVLLCALGLALVLTDYHFISDIIAGTYLGYLVVQAIDRGMQLLPQRRRLP